jgi:hypothetical protein
MSTVKEIYGHIALELIKNSIHSGHIDSEAVYQEANKSNRAILNKIIGDLILPGSAILKLVYPDPGVAEASQSGVLRVSCNSTPGNLC